MVTKYYAVISGHTPGVYTDWSVTEQMLHNYPGAFFRSFSSRKEADTYVSKTLDRNHQNNPNNQNIEPLIYVFGNDKHGYGLMIKANNTVVTAYGHIDRSEVGFSALYGIYIALSLVTGPCVIFHNMKDDLTNLKDDQIVRAIKEKFGLRKVTFHPLTDTDIEQTVAELARTGGHGTESYVVFKNGVRQS
jgi:hypothetical protein